MLVDQIDYLYDMVDRKPAGDAYRRHDELVVELERLPHFPKAWLNLLHTVLRQMLKGSR